MAINSGVRQVVAYLLLDAGPVPVTKAEVHQTATRKSSSYSVAMPMDALPQGMDESAFVGKVNGGVSVSINGGEPVTLAAGPIDEVTFDYSTRMLAISGRDQSAALHETKSSEKFQNKTPQDVIKDVAQRAGLQADIRVSGSALQAGKINQIEWAKMTEDHSLASVIHKMSEFLGARWFVQGSNLVVTDGSSSTGDAYTVTYIPPIAEGSASSDFKSLTIRRDLQLSQDLTTEVKGWHNGKKRVISSSKTLNGSGEGGKRTYKYQIPNVEQDHADKHAASALAEHARHEISVSVELVGDPSIDISKGLQLIGFVAFSQMYDIDSINHVIAPMGYVMAVEAKGAAKGRSMSQGGDSMASGVAGSAAPLPVSADTGDGVNT